MAHSPDGLGMEPRLHSGKVKKNRKGMCAMVKSRYIGDGHPTF